MSTDLEDVLLHLDGPTLDQPVDRVLARGDHLRRRRRAGALAGLAAIAVLGIVLTPQLRAGTPTTTPAAQAPADDRIHPDSTVDFTGKPTNLSSTELRRLSTACLDSAYKEPLRPDSTAKAELPPGTLPTVAERRSSMIEAVFRGDGHLVVCSTTGGLPTGQRPDPRDGLGQVLALSQRAAHAWPESFSGGPKDGPVLVLRVPDEVASATVTFGRRSFPTVIVDGLAVAWLHPGQVGRQIWGDSGAAPHRGYTWRAYDADGDRVKVPLSDR